MSREAGFTLVELMITLAVAAILVTIALPSFTSTMRSTRIATRSNELMASVSLARQEAIRSNIGSGVCATSDNGVSCSANWNGGWMVFDDLNGNATFDGGDTVVRVSAGDGSMNMTTTGGGTIAFNSRGLYLGGAAATFQMTPTDCPAGFVGIRNFRLLTIGQLIMTKATCP